MKPDWDKLMEEFKDNPTAGVFDVDCTAEGEALCEVHEVQGFPTIKYGDPSDLQEYQGGRDYDSLKSFAEENLKPMCSPANIDLCDDAKKAEIKKYQDMDVATLKSTIEGEEKKVEDANDLFESEVEKLQQAYEKLMEDKDKAIADVKASGLGIMKSVMTAKLKTDASTEEEL